MFTPVKLVVLLTAAISVAAMPSAHLARQGHHHREIAARVAQPDGAPFSEMAPRNVPALGKRLRKRAGTNRCSSSSSSLLPSPSPAPSPSIAGDVKGDPQPSSTPPQDPATTPSPSPSPDQQDPNTPTPTPSPDQQDPNTPAPSPTPTTSDSPTPSPTSGGGNNNGGSGGGGQVYVGQGTFYSTGLGACGITNNDGQDIAAVSHLLFDTFPGYDGVNPNANPICGKTAQVTFGGVTITVALTDRCEACAYDDLDFSPDAFDKLADPSVGRISGIQWTILD